MPKRCQLLATPATVANTSRGIVRSTRPLSAVGVCAGENLVKIEPQKRIASLKPPQPHSAVSIAVAASARASSSRCPYTSAVTRIDECPSISETTLSGTF